MIRTFVDSFWAGLMIAIASAIYMSTSHIAGGIPAAILFSCGLLTISWFGMVLYTGKIGYARSVKEIPNYILILVGNLCGGICIMLFGNRSAAESIVYTKIQTFPQNWIAVFVSAILCGILIYIAVDQYKQGRWYGIIVAVPAFILCGARHCIAEFCYIAAAHQFSLTTLLYFGIVVIGNTIGSIIFSLWEEHKKT